MRRRTTRCLVVMLLGVVVVAPGVSEAQVTVVGAGLVDSAGVPLTLRGANWGWWGCVESGDARLMKSMGANLLRIGFFYSRITDPPEGDTLGGEGLALLDAMCRWADEAGLLFVLNCHEPPGGCNTAHWCAGGRNRLWVDEAEQARYLAMWRALVRRYRHHPNLMAYELMNEPAPPPDYPFSAYTDLCLRAIEVIREEDPGRPIVVSGLRWGSPEALTDDLILPRPNLIYTFHFYYPGALTHYRGGDMRYPGRIPVGERWLSNTRENWGAEKDTDWRRLEVAFTPPAEATHGMVMLRSSHNTGTAWFDDVDLRVNDAPVEFSDNVSFDAERRDSGWRVERKTAGDFAWDADEGRIAPGALRISGTDSYNAWVATEQFEVEPGAEYVLSVWVKTRGTTGHSYPAVAWFGVQHERVDRDWLEARLAPALEFRARHGVPIYCGEFGCSQAAPDGSGPRWVQDVAALLDHHDIPWTYWNWRETTGPGSMGVWVKGAGGLYEPQARLLDVLHEAWRR